MAYRSRLFDVADDRRRTAEAGADPAAPAPAPGGGFGSSSPVPSGSDPGGVNDLRAFFEANRGAGSQMLSDAAERISQQFAGAADTAAGATGRKETIIPGTPGDTAGGYLPDGSVAPSRYGPRAAPDRTTFENTFDQAKMGDAQSAYDKAAGEAKALGSGDLSGIQSLLPQSGSQMGRTLDAWLMQNAAANPSALRGLNSAEARARDIIERQLKRAAGGTSPGSAQPAPLPGTGTAAVPDQRKRGRGADVPGYGGRR